MTSTPWISFETSPGGNTITCSEGAPSSLALDGSSKPCIVTCIGRRTKSTLLSRLLSSKSDTPVHKEVYLWSSTRLRTSSAQLLLVDCGVQTLNQHSLNTLDVSGARTSWKIPSTQNLCAKLCGQVFSPFSSVFCCFVSDLGGPIAAARWVADQAIARARYDSAMPLPRILLVMETTSESFDEKVAANKATTLLTKALQEAKEYQSHHQDAKRLIGKPEVLGLRSYQSISIRARALKRRLLAISENALQERIKRHARFSFAHFQALSKQALSCLGGETFSHFRLATLSRPQGFSTDLLEGCLADFLAHFPTQSWLWHVAAPVIASALLLASYPPNAHHFAPEYLYNAFYLSSCKAAIAAYSMDEEIQKKFLKSLLDEFNTLFETYKSSELSAHNLHREVLSKHQSSLVDLKSHRSCFFCFMRMPEKVLPCGHALCDPCIRIFGCRSHLERNAYEFFECFLCGDKQSQSVFRFVPPTAGARVLTVDGGGVKGMIPLVYLYRLDKFLAPFGCSVQDQFDLVLGTSAGGLVVMGLFLLRWGAAESIKEFEQVASKTFRKRKAILARALQVLVAYIKDGQYSLDAIHEAFRQTFDTSFQMFNPLKNDTKVAVTTTAVEDSSAWLFTNYNGGKRASDLGYDVVRAEKSTNDVTISDAACCTSAAPWFFKPWSIFKRDFQDGGLLHNNPADIAQWETRFIWPGRSDPDFALSLGTGIASPSLSLGMPRFIKRLFNSSMRNLEGENAYKRFYNSLPLSVRPRYHRLNVKLDGLEPGLDDAFQLPNLKAYTLEKAEENWPAISAVTDAMIASMFYFELDDVPKIEGTTYTCSGYIFSRIDHTEPGRRYLYQKLLDTKSWFYIQGNPISCVESIPRGLPPFRRRVTFSTKSVDDTIAFSIRGITKIPKLLSGFPTSLKKLIKDQKLDTPFGTIDHYISARPLPKVPQKRRRMEQQGRSSKRFRSEH